MSTAEIKPATRTSPFYWRDGYEQKINWSGRKEADKRAALVKGGV